MDPIQQERALEQELGAFRHYVVLDNPLFPHKVRRLLQSIRVHAFDPQCNVGFLLDACEIRGNNIHGLFKRHVKMTIRQCLENMRLQAAMWLLACEDLELSLIAFGVGYEHYRTFNRAFLRYAGCTPSDYRSRLREDLRPVVTTASTPPPPMWKVNLEAQGDGASEAEVATVVVPAGENRWTALSLL